MLLTAACQKEITGTGPVNGLAAINVLYAKLDDVSGAIVDSKNGNNGTGSSVIYGTQANLIRPYQLLILLLILDYHQPCGLLIKGAYQFG